MFELPKLPYKPNALEPYISAETMRYHYGKHHAGYVKKLNELTKNTPANTLPINLLLKQLIVDGLEGSDLYNMAGQHYNHSFYWESLTPDGESPKGYLLELIKISFGSEDSFKKNFVHAAMEQFGSGWLWLVQRYDKLNIVVTADAEPILSTYELQPLLVCDLWEHAYYLDYKNVKERYVKNFLRIANWKQAMENLAI